MVYVPALMYLVMDELLPFPPSSSVPRTVEPDNKYKYVSTEEDVKLIVTEPPLETVKVYLGFPEEVLELPPELLHDPLCEIDEKTDPDVMLIESLYLLLTLPTESRNQT